MNKTIAFYRQGYRIVADIILTTREPLGKSRQVVFFCREGKQIYRVPKSEVLWIRPKKIKAKKKRRRVVA